MYEIGRDALPRAGSKHAENARRVRIMYAFFSILFAVFIVKTLSLGVQGTSRTRRALANAEWTASRADIVDRNGEILAKNIVSGNIVLRPPQVKNFDEVANFVHEVMPEIPVREILEMRDSGKKFIYIKKMAPDYQRAAVLKRNLPGLTAEQTEWRRYPKRRMTAHVLGFMGTDEYGLEGVEKTHDAYLRTSKKPLVLSIDSRIQSAMHEALSNAVRKYSAVGAAGIIMDSRTGEIMAMAALPDFDPENLDRDPTENRMFLPMRGVFEMGSIFKIFNTAMAMETGIGLKREYYIAKPYQVLNKHGRVSATIGDHPSFKPPRPRLNVEEILLHSCNAGSAQIALDLPDGTQKEFFERINMSRALDLEFGRTEKPLMPIKWGPVEKATVAFGHGMSVTPMHTMLGVNAMTNGGIYIYPTLEKRSIGNVSGTRVLSADISRHLREILFRIAEETSGKKARFQGINVGGKTSTAEKRIAGVAQKFKNLTAFTAIFPVESPKYIILVILDEPKGTTETYGLRTAAWNAVPVAAEIMDAAIPLLIK